MNPLPEASNSTAEVKKKLITKEEWEKKLSSIEVEKEVMNKLVMNYIFCEGYVETAGKFCLESETQQINLESVTSRLTIKKALEMGEVEDAIQKINDLNPEILDTNPLLFFHLQLQKLVELIRKEEYALALEFSTEVLCPLVEENANFAKELEETFALLCLKNAKSCPLNWLLDQAQRDKRANEVNAAILRSQHQDGEVYLETLLKMLKWADDELLQTTEFPSVDDLSEATVMEPHST